VVERFEWEGGSIAWQRAGSGPPAVLCHGTPFFRFVQEHPTVLGELPAHIHEAIVRTYILGASRRGLSNAQIDPLVRPWLAEEGRPAFYRQIADYDETFLEDNERRLAALTIPVRVRREPTTHGSGSKQAGASRR
jgi:hypothetical protein